MGYFDRFYQQELVQKYNMNHDEVGRFSASDLGNGPDRRAEVANTQDRHLKASSYHWKRSKELAQSMPHAAAMHVKASQLHMIAASSKDYHDRRMARDISVYAHGMEGNR